MNQITPDTVEHTERFNHENFAVQSNSNARRLPAPETSAIVTCMPSEMPESGSAARRRHPHCFENATCVPSVLRICISTTPPCVTKRRRCPSPIANSVDESGSERNLLGVGGALIPEAAIGEGHEANAVLAGQRAQRLRVHRHRRDGARRVRLASTRAPAGRRRRCSSRSAPTARGDGRRRAASAGERLHVRLNAGAFPPSLVSGLNVRPIDTDTE